MVYEGIHQDLEDVKEHFKNNTKVEFDENTVFELLENLFPLYGPVHAKQQVIEMINAQIVVDNRGLSNNSELEVINGNESNDSNNDIIEVSVPKKNHPFIDLTALSESDDDITINNVQNAPISFMENYTDSENEIYKSDSESNHALKNPFANQNNKQILKNESENNSSDILNYLALMEDGKSNDFINHDQNSSSSEPNHEIPEMLEENNNDPNNNFGEEILNEPLPNMMLPNNNFNEINRLDQDNSNINLTNAASTSDNSTDVYYDADHDVNMPCIPPIKIHRVKSPVPGCSKDFKSFNDLTHYNDTAVIIDETIADDAICIKEIVPWADSKIINSYLLMHQNSPDRKQKTLWKLMEENSPDQDKISSKRKQNDDDVSSNKHIKLDPEKENNFSENFVLNTKNIDRAYEQLEPDKLSKIPEQKVTGEIKTEALPVKKEKNETIVSSSSNQWSVVSTDYQKSVIKLIKQPDVLVTPVNDEPKNELHNKSIQDAQADILQRVKKDMEDALNFHRASNSGYNVDVNTDKKNFNIIKPAKLVVQEGSAPVTNFLNYKKSPLLMKPATLNYIKPEIETPVKLVANKNLDSNGSTSSKSSSTSTYKINQNPVVKGVREEINQENKHVTNITYKTIIKEPVLNIMLKNYHEENKRKAVEEIKKDLELSTAKFFPQPLPCIIGKPPQLVATTSKHQVVAPGGPLLIQGYPDKVPDQEIYNKLRAMFHHVKSSYIKRICIGYNNLNKHRSKEELLDTLINHLLKEGNKHIRLETNNYEQSQIVASIDEQHEYLAGIFPDADPNYLRDFVEKNHSSKNVIDQFIQQKLETHDYPTKEQYLAKIKITEQLKQYTTDFRIDKFLELFPDPFKHFENRERKCIYQPIAFEFLKSYFKRNKVTTISREYRHNNYILGLTAKSLDAIGPDMKSKRTNLEMPTENIPLLQEITFIKNRDKINLHIETLKSKEEQMFKTLKAQKLLITCQCCFNDECMPDKSSECDQGHQFCYECIIRGSETTLADGNVHIKCFTDCSGEFPLATLQKVLPPTKFSVLLIKRQAAEVMAAGVDGLVSCPFCHFASIPPPEDKVFKCLNPECMKESCRLCKELNHIPLKCDEVGSKVDKARRLIEEKMTEALVRTCYKCKRQFFKEDGCNKMKCPCGALMCYICDKPIKDYKHFNAQGGENANLCPLWSDDRRMNAQAVIRVAEEYKKALLKSNPNLKLDTEGLVPKLPPKSRGPHEDIASLNELPEHVRRIAEAAQNRL